MMHWQYTPYVLPLFLAAAISGVLALFAWRRRPAPGATCLALVMLGAAEWSLGYAVALGIRDLAVRIFLAKMQHLGIAVIAPALLVLVLQYTGYDKWLTRRNLILLAIVPFIEVLLAWTNEAHGLTWADMKLTIRGSLPALDLKYGAYFWVNATYSYLLLLLAAFLLLRTVLLSSGLERSQSAIMLTGMLIPWLGNFLYLSGWNPFPYLDLTPFSYSLAGLVVAWGLFRYRLVDIMPVAREAVVESMSDVVIVLDAKNRIVNLNRAGEHIIGRKASEAIGQSITQILSGQLDLTEHHFNVKETGGEIEMSRDGKPGYFDARISPLHDQKGRLTGRLVVLRDITERKQAERKLARSNALITALSHVAARIETAPDPDGVMKTLGAKLEEIGVTCVVALREPGTQALFIRYASFESDSIEQAEKSTGLRTSTFRFTKENTTLFTEVIQNRRPVFVEDSMPLVLRALQGFPRPVVERAMRLVRLETDTPGIYLPLTIEDKVLGMLAMWGKTLQEDDVQALSVFTSQVAIAIENARLYNQARKEIDERKWAEEKLKASLKEKEVLLQEIHHRVKNNMQIISSLLNLQSRYVKDDRYLELLKESEKRIDSMALIHEKLYQSEDLARIDFGAYIGSLAHDLFQFYSVDPEKIVLKLDVDDIVLGVDTAIPCGLIVNELLSNCLKHAFPDGMVGAIEVALDMIDENEIELVVSDNGVGMPEGMNLENVETLGLYLVANLATKQLMGKLELDRGEGTKFRLRFKDPMFRRG